MRLMRTEMPEAPWSGYLVQSCLMNLITFKKHTSSTLLLDDISHMVLSFP